MCGGSPRPRRGQARPSEAPYREASEDDLEALEKAFRSNPGSLDVLYRLGRVSLQRAQASGKEREEHLDRAAKVFRAMLLQPLDASAPCSKASVFYYLGLTSHLRGEPAKARNMLERALENDPDLAEAKSLMRRLQP